MGLDELGRVPAGRKCLFTSTRRVGLLCTAPRREGTGHRGWLIEWAAQLVCFYKWIYIAILHKGDHLCHLERVVHRGMGGA